MITSTPASLLMMEHPPLIYLIAMKEENCGLLTLNLKNKKIDIAKHLFIMNNKRLPKYLFNGLTNN